MRRITLPALGDPVGRRLMALAAALALLVAAGVVLAFSGVTDALDVRNLFRQPAPSVEVEADPYTDRTLYVEPDSLTAQAAAVDPRLNPLAETPQAKWFTDWTTAATIETDLGTYLAGATARHEIPVAVLYRIPNRDCGAYAAGGAATAEEYRAWIDGAARALQGHEAIVILEPDAVGQLRKCTTDRVELLSYATTRLATTDAWVYLDGGHADWQTPLEMAKRLDSIGIANVRGFATNVANYNAEAKEKAYADQLVNELAELGVKNPHYVIDTGRAGAAVDETDHCNALGARLGAPPELVFQGALDARLWVKNPGESDGKCYGGPQVGFWNELALMVLGLPNDIEGPS